MTAVKRGALKTIKLQAYLCPMSHAARRYIAFALLLISALIGGSMYLRFTEEKLWGFAPLFLFLTLYGGVTLLATFRRKGVYRPNNLYSTLTGLLLGFGFPGLLPFPFLLLIGFVPMFVLHGKLTEEKAGYGRVFWHGFSAFLLFNILATYWVTNTGLAAGLFAIIANSLLMTLPWLAFHWTSRKSPRIAFLAFAVCWLSFEYLHYNWSLNWPWLTLGNGFAQLPSLVQWYEVTGALGGSAWVLGCNYLAFKWYTAPASAPKKALLPLAIALFPIVGSLLRYATYSAPAGDTIKVASIQPNFEPHFEKFSNDVNSQLDTFLRLSLAALEEGPVDYLVYPETSFDNIEVNDLASQSTLRRLQAGLDGKGAHYLMTGISGYYIFAEGEAVTPAVRYIPRRDGSLVALEALNAAVQLDLQGDSEPQLYKKGVFVPGAESFPFRKIFWFLEDWVNQLGGTVAGRGTQDRRLPMTSPTAKIAPVICYESVFGEYFTDYIREGAQAIFVVTNDGWWDNTAGHRQHLWFSSLRAIETRRSVVRSANTGICAFIDQRGKIISKTRYDEAVYLRGEMQLNDAITPFVRFGDLVARVALLLTGMILLSNVARSLRRE